MSKVKVATIGFGHLGKWHAQKAHGLESAELVAIVESFETNRKLAQENYPDVKVVASIDEVMSEIDAAVVVTPTSTHFELVKKLLQNDKHVFCEKPLCETEEEAIQLKDYLGDRVLQVGHSERCHEAWDKLRDKFQAMNTKKSIELNRYASFKGRATDVDVVQDLMIHDIDLLLYLFKERPASVRSIGHKIRTDKWDHVVTHFYYETGDHAIITAGRNHIKEVRSLEVMSEYGCDFVDLFANKIYHGTNSKFSDGSYVQEEDYAKRDHLLIEHQNFYDAVLNKKIPMVTYQDGLDAIHIISKIIESLDTGKEVNL